MTVNDWYTKWLDLDRKTKLMAFGTVAIVIASIFLSFSSCSALFDRSATTESSLIAATDKPIPYATHETLLVTSLMDVLSDEGCLWKATDDELCGLEFTNSGFTEYNGDIETAAIIEFYAIAASQNGREGIWRVVYEDGSVHDATFRFTQDLTSGKYVIESEALPTYQAFQTKSLSSLNLL